MNFKKTLSLVLAVLMVITVVPFSGLAADCDHDYKATQIDSQEAHWYKCTKCGTVDISAGMEACSGGTAEKCGEKAKCTICDGEYGEAAAHNFTEKTEADAYLADAGNCQTFKKYYYNCANPDCTAKGTETFDSTTKKGEHKWDAGTPNGDATCTADGTKKLSCTVTGCNEKKDVADAGSALGHDFTEKIIDVAHLAEEGNCKKKYSYYFDCSRCNFNAKDLTGDVVKPTFETEYAKHVFVEPENLAEGELKSAATCTSKAVYYKECYDCGISAKGIDESETYEYGELAAHNYINFVDVNDEAKNRIAQLTCTDTAIYAKSCKVCGVSALEGKDTTDPTTEIYIDGELTEEEIKNGKVANAFRYGTPRRHYQTKVTKEAKEPTCTTDGWTVEVSCALEGCGKLVDGKFVSTVLTESEKIDKLGHDCDLNNPIEKYKAPTCKQYGTIGKVECSRCKATFAINEKNELMSIDNLNTFIFSLEPLGHADDDGDMICDRCTAILEAEDLCTCIACNGTGIMYFIGVILKWIWSLMGTNQYCECGAAHY